MHPIHVIGFKESGQTWIAELLSRCMQQSGIDVEVTVSGSSGLHWDEDTAICVIRDVRAIIADQYVRASGNPVRRRLYRWWQFRKHRQIVAAWSQACRTVVHRDAVLLVRYEDVCKAPAVALCSLLAALDTSIDSAVISQVVDSAYASNSLVSSSQYDQMPYAVNAWAEDMPVHHWRPLTEHARDMLETFGYEPAPTAVSS